MRRYFIISAILHIVVFAGLYFLPMLLIRGQEPTPPPLNLTFLPPPEPEVKEEEPTPEPTAKKTPSPEPTDFRSMVGRLSPSLTPTPTPTSTRTQKPSATPTPTPSPREATQTPTLSPTPVPPTETPVPATSTPTSKPTRKPTETPKPTVKPTNTSKPTETPKATDTPGPTHSPTPNPTKQVLAKALKDAVSAIKKAESGPESPVPVEKKGVPGAALSGVGGDGEGSGLITSVPFADYGYLGRLQTQLKDSFKPPLRMTNKTRRTATVKFTIMSSGEITGIEIVTSSGHKGIDKAAMAAVDSISPFEPLPGGTTDLGVTCEFVAD